MHATHLHCPQCRTAQPIRFEPLLAGESSLGTRVSCARCARHAFTLIRPARFYCEICDEVQPGVLEPVDMESLFAELGENPDLRAPLPAGTHVGHVNLHVSDLKAAQHFYARVLGFPARAFNAERGNADLLGLQLEHA